jgi:hypothetical protein
LPLRLGARYKPLLLLSLFHEALLMLGKVEL